MTHKPESYKALVTSEKWMRRGCLNDDEFIADDLKARERLALAEICSRCPVFQLCEDYATTTNPAAGFWAGVRYPVAAKR